MTVDEALGSAGQVARAYSDIYPLASEFGRDRLGSVVSQKPKLWKPIRTHFDSGQLLANHHLASKGNGQRFQ